MTEDFKKLQDHVQKVAERENCFLYDLQWVGQGQGRILRVFIDKEGEEGVSIDDCSNVSRGLDLVLDVEDLVPGGAYQLEVSSPGLERHLSQSWHYKKAVGELVSFNLNRSLGELPNEKKPKDPKRKKLSAVIKSSTETAVEVIITESKEDLENKEELSIPLEAVHKAKVVYAFENNFSKKKAKAKKG